MYVERMKNRSRQPTEPKLVANCSREITISSLSEINRALRQQVVDLALSIAVMKEDAAIQSATMRSKTGAAADPMETAFESASRSLRSAGPAKSKTRDLHQPKPSDHRQ